MEGIVITACPIQLEFSNHIKPSLYLFFFLFPLQPAERQTHQTVTSQARPVPRLYFHQMNNDFNNLNQLFTFKT
jgi:hypothetical protein